MFRDHPEIDLDAAIGSGLSPTGGGVPGSLDFVPAEPPEMVELRALLARARVGDERALPRLRQILDGHPEVWTWYGDLAAHAAAQWIALASGPDLGLAESLRRKLEALKSELTGPDPAPIERLLVDRIVATWVELNWSEAVVAQVTADGSASPRRLDFVHRRRDRAERRHLAALGGLATLQRLLPAARRSTTSEPTALSLYGRSGADVEDEDEVRRPARRSPGVQP